MSAPVRVAASAKVGQTGTVRHVVEFNIWVYPDRTSISDGTVICGARRAGARSHSFTLNPNDANCQRCLDNWYVMQRAADHPDAATILEFDRRGALVVKEGAL